MIPAESKLVRAYVDLDGDLMVDCHPFGDRRARRATATERAESMSASASTEGWILTTVSERTLSRIGYDAAQKRRNARV